jgi:benzodiazapine receptor
MKMATANWYSQLKKPNWAPPSWLFGPVWAFLYLIIAVSFSTIFYKALTQQISLIIALPFVLNLIFNFAFTPIQFGLKNNLLAAFDIIIIVGTLVWAFVSVWQVPDLHWALYVNIPYLLWGSFATTLQLTITYLNTER